MAEEEIDRQILKKYEIQTKLGKGAYGVSYSGLALTEAPVRADWPGATVLPKCYCE